MRKLLLVLLIILGLPFLFFLSVPTLYKIESRLKSPQKMFKQLVSDPIPTSVRVISGYQWASPGDMKAKLHFTSSRGDCDLIIANLGLSPTQENRIRTDPEVPWWSPDAVRGYESYSRAAPNRWQGYVAWINHEHTDVYLEYWKL